MRYTSTFLHLAPDDTITVERDRPGDLLVIVIADREGRTHRVTIDCTPAQIGQLRRELRELAVPSTVEVPCGVAEMVDV